MRGDRLARLIVRLSAWLVPRDVRARWREEWLGEIGAASVGRTRVASPGSRQGQSVLRRAIGAPVDALAWRLSSLPARGSWSNGWRSDLRDVLHEWRRAPVRSATTVVCLTIGLAATLMTFALVNTMFSGEIPGVEDRSTLARIRLMRSGFVDDPDVNEFRAAAAAPFETLQLAAEARRDLTSIIDGEPFRLEAHLASGSLFDVLGTTPQLGRLLQAADDRPEAPSAAVISDTFWRRHFGGRADVIGQRLSIAAPGSGQPPRSFEVVGVTPPGFAGVGMPSFGVGAALDRPTVWIPLTHAPATDPRSRRRDDVVVVARVSGARSLAADELRSRIPAVADAAAGPSASWRARSIEVLPVYNAPVTSLADLAGFGILALGVPLAVLLVVCLNVAALRLASGVARRHELAIRASLGASRGRLVRLLVIDAASLAAVSAIAAWAVATRALTFTAPLLASGVTLDGRVLACAVALTAGATVLAGLWPALRSTSGRFAASLAAGTHSAGASNVRLYRWLVGAQMALSVVLLASGMLAGRSAHTLGGGHLADIVGPVASARLTFADSTIDESRRHLVLTEIQDRVAALPGVDVTALSTMDELNVSSLMDFEVVGATGVTPTRPRAYVGLHGGRVSASYFETFGLTAVEGRLFGSDDATDVVVITAAMRAYLPPERPAVGTRLRLRLRDGERIEATVIGVVEKAVGLADARDRTSSTPIVFAPMRAVAPATTTLFARATDPRATAHLVSGFVRDASTPLLVENAGAMVDRVAAQRGPMLWLASALGGAAALATGVAAMGLWAVAAIGVTRRQHEFGVRLAIGADRAAIAGLLLTESLRVAALGGAVGTLVATPIFFALRSEFVGVEPWDPLALAGTLGVLTAATLAASVGPALRAARVDPLEILRTE